VKEKLESKLILKNSLSSIMREDKLKNSGTLSNMNKPGRSILTVIDKYTEVRLENRR
jgi:septum formation topological specificity factor MinE